MEKEKQLDFDELVRQMTEQVRGLAALQQQVFEAARQVQEVIVFAGHPEMVSLDDELDILYRGQL